MSEGAERRFSARVVDIRLESHAGAAARWQIALDHTEFRSGDVGALEAVARSGVRLVVPVLAIVEEGTGGVWHVVEKPLTEGTSVTGQVLRPG